MMEAVYVAAVILVLYPAAGEGALSLGLVGYTDLPTDGSGRILISDIGALDSGALTCVTDDPGTSTSSDWFYDPTSPTTAREDFIWGIDPRGWRRDRGTTYDGFPFIRLGRKTSQTDTVEGVFTCDIDVDTGPPISVGIYYALTSVDMTINVVSARQRAFTVTCTSSGGTVLNSSLTGPNGLNLELKPVGTPRYMGDDTYHVTTATLTEASDGDMYHCTASNGVPAPIPSDSEMLIVANPPTLLSAKQVSPGTTIRMTWSHPSGGGTVTGYLVHYSGDDDFGSVSRSASATTADLENLMNDGRNYTISVEAQSQQLSGESDNMDVDLLTPPSAPTGVSVSDVKPHSVRVSWSGQSNVDRYTVNYELQQGDTQLGLCQMDRQSGSVTTADSNATSVTVEGTDGDGEFRLRAFATYSVTVTALSESRSNSDASDPVLFTTAQTAADAPPTVVQASAESSTSITVVWTRISLCRDINGLIVSYDVRYQALPSSGVETATVPGVWNAGGEVTLTRLTPFTYYSIEVAAVNNQSDVGEFSEPVITQTKEDTPGPVSITSSKTFFQIEITWEKPERPNGVIIAYEVSYHPTADPQSVTRVNTTDLATSLTVRELQPGTELSFTVRAYTQVGAGETNTVIEVTYISAPPVENVVATTINATAVRVTWRALELELNYYTILYSVVSGGRTESLSANVTSVVVGGLGPGEEYTFHVVAVAEINGSIVEGERSAVATATTFGAILVQLRLRGISSCRNWTERSKTDKMKDISNSLLQMVQGFCVCAFSALNIDSEVFLCFDDEEDSVTYRARLLATADVDTQSLSSHLEEWVAAGSSVVVGRNVLSVDKDCSGEIADLLQEEEGCRADSVSSDFKSTGAVAGGAAVAVLVVAIIAVLVIVILKRRSNGTSVDSEKSQVPLLDTLHRDTRKN